MNDSMPYTARTPTESAILEQLRLWREGAIERDSARLSQVFADDLIALTPNSVLTKSAIIDYYLNKVHMVSVESSNICIRVFGNIAVVTRHNHIRAEDANGTKRENTHASVDVFVERNGKWVCVAT